MKRFQHGICSAGTIDRKYFKFAYTPTNGSFETYYTEIFISSLKIRKLRKNNWESVSIYARSNEFVRFWAETLS